MRTIKLLAVLTLVFSGCISSKLIANNMVDSMGDMKKSFFAEESATYAREAGPGMLKMLDGFIYSSPENIGLLAHGTEINCAYAQTFLDDHDRDWAQVMYKRGRGFGMRGLGQEYPDLVRAIDARNLDQVKKELEEVDPDHLRILFWTGICWGGQINAAQEAGMVPQLPYVRALIDRAMEIDENYYFSAGYIFYGTFWAGRSAMLGGDLEKGRGYFEEALKRTNETFLMWKFQFAKVYAIQAQKPELFVRLMTEVAQAPQELDNDENRLPNQVVREEARRYLDHVRDYFPNYQPPEPEGMFEEEDIDDLDLD